MFTKKLNEGISQRNPKNGIASKRNKERHVQYVRINSELRQNNPNMRVNIYIGREISGNSGDVIKNVKKLMVGEKVDEYKFPRDKAVKLARVSQAIKTSIFNFLLIEKEK